MILSVLAALLLLLPAALGGRLSRLASVRIRGQHWLLLGLGLQVAAIGLGGMGQRGLGENSLGENGLGGGVWHDRPALATLHVASYVLLGAVLWANRALPGAWLIGAGGLSNGLTIAVNGGTLPASAQAMRTAGLVLGTADFTNSGLLSRPRLGFLGDVFAIPAPIPLANVFSIGDVLILLGVAVAAIGICGTRWTRPERGTQPEQALVTQK